LELPVVIVPVPVEEIVKAPESVMVFELKVWVPMVVPAVKLPDPEFEILWTPFKVRLPAVIARSPDETTSPPDEMVKPPAEMVSPPEETVRAVKVGELEKTTLPVPVSSVKEVAREEEGKEEIRFLLASVAVTERAVRLLNVPVPVTTRLPVTLPVPVIDRVFAPEPVRVREAKVGDAPELISWMVLIVPVPVKLVALN